VLPPLIPLTWSMARLASSCGAASTNFCMQWLSCLSCLSPDLVWSPLWPCCALLCAQWSCIPVIFD
jgi:hypothetical protein